MLHCVLINKAWVQQGVTDNLQIISSCGDRYPVCGAGFHGKSENLESPVTESLYQRTGLRQSEVAAFQINLLY